MFYTFLKIDQNLLSVGQLLEKGYKVLFEDKTCMIKDSDNKELFRVQMKGKSFALNLIDEEQLAMHKVEDNTLVWHKRMGHFHHGALLYLRKNDLVRGLPELEEKSPVCAACQYGKQTRLPFPKGKSWRATNKLQLVHTDVGGPQKTPSLNGSKYYIAFIDDFSRMCWIYFMKNKTEVASIFYKFKAWVENQSGRKLQILRSDNGTEYTSDKFSKFCEDAGIEHQLTAPYTLQQNGVVERKNRTVLEMARCLLHDKDLPKKFWAEAASTSVFLLNRLPTKALSKSTPFEAWYGFKPKLINLKVFGCLCFSYIPQIKRDKLDKKAEAGIFVGYSSTSKAYRIFLPQSNKIIVSRDVQFFEEEKWSNESEKKPLQVQEEESEEDVDDQPIRGTRSLSDIYQRCNVAVMEPVDYNEAATDSKWVSAMKEELDMIEKHQTWELTEKPKDKNVIGVKWVYRTKFNADGSVNKHKARLVVKGYAQMFGVDFSETFSPVARLDTIRLLLALAAQKGWIIHHMDVKSAFLNGYLEEEIFVEQPEGFLVHGQEEKVYRLKKALYGLKQAPRSWYGRIDAHLISLGFEKSLSEFTLYVKKTDAGIIIVSLYVDDLLMTGSSKELIEEFKGGMKEAFEMTDLRKMSFFLGMQVQQDRGEVFISQEKYAKEILRKFKMEECKPSATPMNQKEKFSIEDGAEKVDEKLYRSLIGCLMYLTATRPDITYAVSLLSRYMHCASQIHFKAAKRILRYIKGTICYGVKFQPVKDFSLYGYSDSDWAGSNDDMKSTSGYCFTFGYGVFS
ncbi:hypothetical protein Fmac_007242 [Flemingia macrophylla]|uniref:Integrase catalytic domain-containing protein n=1 Tax=Flemingia macrophylla TaxID=520843 RepID=A0ABD1NCW7_9FABA